MNVFVKKKKKNDCDLEQFEGPLKAYKKHYSETKSEFAITVTNNNLFYIVDGLHDGLLRQIVNESVPKALPFNNENQVKLYWNDFLYDPEEHDDFDTVGIYYASVDAYGMKKPVDIFRYFRRPVTEYEKQYGKWVEITEEKYYARFKAAAAKEKVKKK